MENKNMKRQIIVSVIVSAIVCVSIVSVWNYFKWSDKRVEQSAEIYRACILKEYNQTPESCREANGGVNCSCPKVEVIEVENKIPPRNERDYIIK